MRSLYNLFSSAACAGGWAEIVGNGYTRGWLSYPSSLRPNSRLTSLGIRGRTWPAPNNVDSDFSVQCTLSDHGLKGLVPDPRSQVTPPHPLYLVSISQSATWRRATYRFQAPTVMYVYILGCMCVSMYVCMYVCVYVYHTFLVNTITGYR